MDQATKPPLVITRTVAAPRPLVYKLWSEQEHLQHWWGPKGMPLKIISLDFKPGGKFHYGLDLPNGGTMWGLFIYQEMVAPERMVYISSFSNEKGEPAKSPFPFEWPLEVHNTLTFRDAGSQTILKLESSPLNASTSELESFEKMRSSMEQGFAGTFEQLEAHVLNVLKQT